MKKFAKTWENEIKWLAEACILDKEFIRLMEFENCINLTPEDNEYIERVSTQYKDLPGMYYISEMIKKVDRALEGGYEEAAICEVTRVYFVLYHKNHFLNVFGNDKESQEYKCRVELFDALIKLFEE